MRGAAAAVALSGALISPPRVVPAPAPPVRAEMTTTALARGRVTTRSGASFDVEVVSDPRSREQGMMHRKSVPDGTGMLFVFPAPGRHRFWMCECLTALDIIWMDAKRRVIAIEEKLPPCTVVPCTALPCPDYGPDEDALYVLEVGPGVASKAGIRRGETLGILFAEPPKPT